MVLSWGRVHRLEHEELRVRRRSEIQSMLEHSSQDKPLLAHGLGRSYGDVALNGGGRLAITPIMDHIIFADWDRGLIRASAGLSLEALLTVCVPNGWFLPVTPGTKFVTLGGAVANDIHGKNHHQAGSFGAHITAFELVRSDMGVIECSPDSHSELFSSTVGGLGLTGIITWVELQLKPISCSDLYVENFRYANLDAFFKLSEESANWEYTVTWVDCFAPEKSLGRGVFTRGRFAEHGELRPHKKGAVTWPIATPGFLLNRLSISAFNALYRARPAAAFHGHQHYDPFFYPLDKIHHWNKLYGARGFFQHQSLIPLAHGDSGIRELLKKIRSSGQGSFLAVLKVHGAEQSPGLMSFCREGVSLALDFPNKGTQTRKLLSALDEITMKYGGRVYPAKDGCMAPDAFKVFYPHWAELEAHRDPKISSSFWRRVTISKDVEYVA
ncbi:MAG: FAD-binding oxidoreductase [Pseudomonadota bacterium]